MAFDGRANEMILFGGTGVNGVPRHDTWAWNGQRWTELHPAASPPPLTGAAMSYDTSTNQLVLFGGMTGRWKSSAETWLFESGSWQRADPASSPPGCAWASAAHDDTSGQLVLFGGARESFSETTDDTWTWDGSTWIRQTSLLAPPPSAMATMAYDGSTRQVVLLLAGDASDATSVESWAWDGRGWTRLEVALPPLRAGAASAWDRRRSELIVFGGTGGPLALKWSPAGIVITASPLDDTWAWNGVSWQNDVSEPRPSARLFAAMGYDPQTERIELFGGTTWNLALAPDAVELTLGTLPVPALGDMWSRG